MLAMRTTRLPILDARARAQLARLHAAIDTMVTPLTALHAERLQCKRGCHACCVDDLTVFALEATRIAEHHRELLESGEPHAAGACAFLDAEGGCRIYAQRPYVCRTQGLPLRWYEEAGGRSGEQDAEQNGDELVELRDICELNLRQDEGAVALTELPAEHCFTLGPVEQRLRELAEHARAAERIPLRSLFVRARG